MRAGRRPALPSRPKETMIETRSHGRLGGPSRRRPSMPLRQCCVFAASACAVSIRGGTTIALSTSLPVCYGERSTFRSVSPRRNESVSGIAPLWSICGGCRLTVARQIRPPGQPVGDRRCPPSDANPPLSVAALDSGRSPTRWIFATRSAGRSANASLRFQRPGAVPLFPHRSFRRDGRRRYELAFPALTAGADIVGQ
jgi:hypothetical protein